MIPSADVLALSQQFEWRPVSMLPGQSGPQQGRGAGQSTDFLDHRPYVMGDDIRRIDWNAVARTDQLLIKRFQEEIRPSVTLLVDDSVSMSVFEDKHQRLVDGVAWLSESISHLEVSQRILALESGLLSVEQCVVGAWSASGQRSLGESIPLRLNQIPRGTHLVILSDLLSPHEPTRLLRMLRERVTHCTVIQILSTSDWNFEVGGVLQVQDSETGQILEISMTPEALDRYHQRVTQIQSDWRTGVQGWGEFVVMQAPTTWSELCVQLLQQERLQIVS
jgi:hypothetical protein